MNHKEMNTTFLCRERELHLIRYPAATQHVSLQAWDSADELLIDYIMESVEPACLSQLLILNDDFGALGCWFANHAPAWMSDSWIAHRSLYENLIVNQQQVTLSNDKLVQHPVHALPSTATMPDAPALVVLKIPRTLNMLEYQLTELARVISPTTKIIAGGKVKSITRNVLQLFEKHIGQTTTSLARKKSRLIFASSTATNLTKQHASSFPNIWQHTLPNGKPISLLNEANVFSGQSIDIGARIMLEHMQVEQDDHVVDLGCGNGILGLNALALASGVKATFVDESFMALASAKQNVQSNFPEHLSDCDFIASNCLEELLKNPPSLSVSKVFCNPPFHQQNTITDHIAWQMFQDSKKLLKKGGHLMVVGNRHLDYHSKLKRIFGNVKLIASNQKFVILLALKR